MQAGQSQKGLIWHNGLNAVSEMQKRWAWLWGTGAKQADLHMVSEQQGSEGM